MTSLIKPALSLFTALSLVTGVAYPLLTTALAQTLYASAANGSLVRQGGTAVGSSLIGQQFSAPGYFWGRPSATGSHPYNGLASSGSNLAPSNPALVDAMKERMAALKAADPSNTAAVPIDLLTASASGLDPHISPAAARYQAARVASARKLEVDAVNALIDSTTEQPMFGFIGEARVNVLQLNVALSLLK